VAVAGVLFDMDGTLVDSTAVVESMWSQFAIDHGLDPEVVIPFSHGRPTLDTMAHFLPGLTPGQRADLEAQFTAQEVLRTDGVVEIPGAAALVARLIEADAPLGVVTSAGRELAGVRMAAAGVPVPPVLVTPDDVAAGKPDPEGYLRAAARLGVRIDQCLVFEDAEAGLMAAVASGARVAVVGTHASGTTRGLARVPDLAHVTAGRRGDGVWVRVLEPDAPS